MPRPNIVRADTHDLQSYDSPVAQDHSNASSSSIYDANGFGSSQSQAIRTVAEEQAQAQIAGTSNGFYNHHQMGQQDEDELDRELADAEIAGDEGGFDDDMMDKMSSSPSIADEDIDFDMVYALHHFNATVEGQANAAKGEHMVLLDDSNSYWWLVRIVRDSSIGYLPAEHIETPTERLARLNKHRNIDLAANMLSDSVHERSKNPIKKAMRRRNAKTVTFTSPTYHEASEYEYSSDEEEEGQEEGYFDDEEDEGSESQDGTEERKKHKATNGTAANAVGRSACKSGVNVLDPPANDPRITSESNKATLDASKQRPNPTASSLRHPDSAIFHDENQGTKKLTLTPNLLRDDSISRTPVKPEVIKGRSSLDREKQQPKREDTVISPPPNSRDGRKAKKGSSVLGNLFKKRGKKGKKDDEDEVDEWLHSGVEKNSIDSNRSIDSVTASGVNTRGDDTEKEKDTHLLQDQKKHQEIQQRQQQMKKDWEQREQREREAQQRKPHSASASISSSITRSIESETQEDRSAVAPVARQPDPSSVQEQNVRSMTASRNPSNGSIHSDQPTSGSPNSSLNDVRIADPQQRTITKTAQTPVVPEPITHLQTRRSHDRLSESPEQITYHDASERPNLSVDTSSGLESTDTSSSIDSSPELIDRSSTFDSITSTVTTVTPAFERTHAMSRTWSDWSLKTYFEDDNDVRDMLVVVQHDKGEVVQDLQHSEITPLYEDSSKRLADITKQLDGMLGDWLQKRGRS